MLGYTLNIGYKDNDVIRPLCIKLPQMTGYVRKFEGNTNGQYLYQMVHTV